MNSPLSISKIYNVNRKSWQTQDGHHLSSTSSINNTESARINPLPALPPRWP